MSDVRTNRGEKIAKIRRDLEELKSRLGRIEGEVFSGKRNCDVLAEELKQLDSEGDTQS